VQKHSEGWITALTIQFASLCRSHCRVSQNALNIVPSQSTDIYLFFLVRVSKFQVFKGLRYKTQHFARRQWLTPIILATQEADIRSITVQSQPEQIVCENLSWKTLHKNRAGGVVQVKALSLSPNISKKEKKNIFSLCRFFFFIAKKLPWLQ
jgi:hypothetical protein